MMATYTTKTIYTFDTVDIGVSIADSAVVGWRNCLRFDFKYRIQSFITIKTQYGSRIITDLVRENGKPDYHYLNKQVVVLGFDHRLRIKAAYSHDSTTLTFLDISILEV